MDEKDAKILSILKNNARTSTREISKKTMLPITTVHNRIKRMRKNGLIKKYTIVPDYNKLGMGILAYIFLHINYRLMHRDSVESELRKLIEPHGIIEDISFVTGIMDIVLKVRTDNLSTLSNFVGKSLRETEFVKDTETHVVLTDHND
ncbi:MAG: Lrp/AsnC family transcriptional regulator [Nanoarchaeota archaeon]